MLQGSSGDDYNTVRNLHRHNLSFLLTILHRRSSHCASQMGGLSGRDLEKLKVAASHPHADPALKSMLKLYEEVSQEPVRQQAENDRRWRILVEEEDKVPEDQKPKTMGAFRDMLAKYGFKINIHMSEDDETMEGHFGDFMESFGGAGMSLLDDYEMKLAPNAKPRCDHCKKEASLQCKQCGEHYCSRECQKEEWPIHKTACKLIAAQRV